MKQNNPNFDDGQRGGESAHARHPSTATQHSRREVLRRLTSAVALATVGIAALADEEPVDPYLPTRHPGCIGQPAPPQVSNDTTIPAEDPFNDIKAMLNIGIGFIPVFGSALNTILNLVWPESKPDLWTQIKDEVAAAINAQAEKDALNALDNTIAGLRQVLSSYASLLKIYQGTPTTGGLTDVIAKASAVETQFEVAGPAFMHPASTDWQAQFLPLLAQLANLHLTFLRDLIWHGRAFGFDADTIAAYQQNYATFNTQYCDHVDAVVPTLQHQFAAAYQRQTQDPLPDAAWYTNSYYPGEAAVAWGAWNAKKLENEQLSQLTNLVLDYRQLWPGMAETSPAHQPLRLTRELLFGPWGAPDWQDIGLASPTPDRSNAPYYADVSPPYPTIANPAPSPTQVMTALTVSTGALITQGGRNFNFPSAVTTFRQAPTPVPYAALTLSSLDLNPVVAVRVDSGRYGSKVGIDFDPTSGFLISALYFTQQTDNGDGTVSRSTSVIGSDKPGWEMKSFAGEDAPVPAGHCLSSVTTPTSVFQLYRNLGKKPADTTYHSIGSILLGFRLIDPELKIKNSTLQSLYVASPVELSLEDAQQVLLQSLASAGAQVSSAAAAAALQEIEIAAERFNWAELRARFWQRVEQVAAASG